MRQQASFLLLVSVYGIFCQSATAQSVKPLSLAEAIRLAQERNPQVSGANARVLGAEARLRGAGALTNPTLSLAQPFGKDTGGLDEGIILTQTFELGDKRRQRVLSARAERDAASAGRAGTRSDLEFAVKSAYFEALLAENESRLAEDALTVSKAFNKAAEIRLQAGDAPRSNLIRSRIELTRAEEALAAAQLERANRFASVKSLTGLPDSAEISLSEQFTAPAGSYSLPNLQANAMINRPDVVAARKLLESRAAALHGARVQSQPDLFVEGRHSVLDPTTGGSSIRVGILFPLFDYGKNRSDAHAAEAAYQEQLAVLKETERSSKLDVETSYRTLEQTQRTVLSFQSGRLDQAKELLNMTQIGYDKGANSVLELLDAQQVYRTEQTEYARALAAFNIAKAALQHAVGGSLR